MLSGSGDVQVRAGVEADLTALTELYNHYIRETSITFDTEPFTPDQRRPWLLSHPKDGPHRLLVAQETGAVGSPGAARATGEPAGAPAAGALLGYATSSPFRPKAAYAPSVEVTVYCAPHATGRGIGSLLYGALFEALATEDVHRAFAGVAQPNAASHRLHTRFSFRHVGTYTEVGRKFGRYWDVAWYQKDLDAAASG
ncbi:GNAT family N-acetyltransferase [Streptomyces gilvosporeus]|uniref:GNAT family N-acetyltransferase n=1 Tax=Streptomyces gilvosporeus TaxID=553510 RepID=A0A1V0TSA9_9ACTN|nr:GNAT family N-acetyltransferase [Streptomyces gilvosporeus]ARF55781.1 GNAT family N-acetyltransferase [Streptomyces gilvosporeus]